MSESWAPLVDTSGLSMLDLMDAIKPGTPVHAALGRLIKSLDDPDGIISAFQSYVE